MQIKRSITSTIGFSRKDLGGTPRIIGVLTIPPTLVGRRMIGPGSPSYSDCTMSPEHASVAPIIVIGGLRKSAIAVPSLRNSGLSQMPKSVPVVLPLVSSKTGITGDRMVPGRNVERMPTIWIPSSRRSPDPISTHTCSG